VKKLRTVRVVYWVNDFESSGGEIARIERKLNVFHQRCLRKIQKVTYKDHITNEEILLWAISRKLSDVTL